MSGVVICIRRQVRGFSRSQGSQRHVPGLSRKPLLFTLSPSLSAAPRVEAAALAPVLFGSSALPIRALGFGRRAFEGDLLPSAAKTVLGWPGNNQSTE